MTTEHVDTIPQEYYRRSYGTSSEFETPQIYKNTVNHINKPGLGTISESSNTTLNI
ncbi:MAG: hypothetical protein MUC29_06995 [Pyrinomonadaceae bacterium]|nr:hypothetical protein [Pyrinomonadaceae bacterium]